jgi:predicted nucleic-acid-binding protein
MTPGRRLVDTNLIVRFLVQDHPKHARAATKLFEASDRGDLILVILPAVIAECVFVLESFYKHNRAEIARVLSAMISSPGVQLTDAALHLDALNRYGASKMHFVDCIIAAHAAASGLPVATFDGDFKRFTDVAVELD